jgi:hypothetical protein
VLHQVVAYLVYIAFARQVFIDAFLLMHRYNCVAVLAATLDRR